MSETGSAASTDTGDEAAGDEPAGPATEASVTATGVVALDALETPWWVRRYTFTGTAVGLIFIWFSMTPSLLPRGSLFQGLVGGFSGAIGYGLGVFGVWLFRSRSTKDSSPPAPRWAWKVLIPVGAVGVVLMAIWFHVW